MSKILVLLTFVCAFFCACTSNVSTVSTQNPAFAAERPGGRDLFFSDSLNARWLYRTYPVPNTVYTPAPKGYKPVYITEYARHGSRNLIGRSQTMSVLNVLEEAAQADCLTPLGQEVLEKVRRIDDEVRVTEGDLTKAGISQHRGIADRMYHNYKNVFCHKNTPVRLYSTVTQRTMMSMFSQNQRLLELNPNIVSTPYASNAFSFLTRVSSPPSGEPRSPQRVVLEDYIDVSHILSRLFTEDMPALKDTASFMINLCSCASISLGMDIEGVDYLWDVFTYDDLYIIQQASNYGWYIGHAAPFGNGKFAMEAMSPLLRHFIDCADAALAEDIPGADLRFGHDSFLSPFSALIGVNGFVPEVENPMDVMEVYQASSVVPMAGNIQMVFYRNRAGDVIVKLLQNEVEAFVPLESDIYPYYHWDGLKAFFESRINPDFL